MFSKKLTAGKRKHNEDNFDSFSHRRLDDLICSDKENVKAFDNIEDLVDNVLAKSKATYYERHVKDIKRIRSFDKKRSAKRPKSYGGVGPVFGISDLVSVKKLFSIVLSFVLLFAVLASASSFVDPDLDGTSVNPEDMLVENTLPSNATISNTNHTDDTLMGENESLNVTNPLDNQTSNIIEGGDTSLNNNSQQANVLDNTTGCDNVSINATTNESIDVSTIDGNQSIYATCLNITLNTDKNSYLVNETVFISDTVVFNNSFVETTVNLSINSSGNRFLHTINTTNGTFSYEYVASKSGNYIVEAHVIFENEAASTNTSFIVSDITDETDDVTVLSLIQGEAVVGESVFWEKKTMVKNNASIQRTLNIATTIPDAVSNIKIQVVSERNEVNYTVLVNQITEKNVSEQISSSTSIMFNRTFDAWAEREFTITYETLAPIKQEISYGGGKRIEIRSNATVHYSNVTAYTELPELSYKPRFYRVINGTRVDVTFDPLYNVTHLDNNSNGKYDGISWNVPRLSNDTYEIDITIIDVQSYPTVGGNWTARFTTTGMANLTITAVNGTTWSNWSEDSSLYDLKFLEIRRGDETLNYTWIHNGPDNSSVFIENYSSDEIGYVMTKVLTSGVHVLEFRFGDEVAYANNLAAPTLSNEQPSNGSTGVSLQPTCNITITDADGDTMNLYWYENSTGSWVLQTNAAVGNGTYRWNFTQASSYDTTYWWKVAVNDSNDNTSAVYHFTTEPINTSVDTISPYVVISSPLTINAAGPPGLGNVTLRYRYSTINSTWWNPSWTYRKKLTIDHNQVVGELTNFPILVNIIDSNLPTKAQSDGDDIAFVLYSDNSTQLNHEIELFNGTSGELAAWVNVTALDSSVDTFIWMYYGNSECNSQENQTGVWDSNYVMVQHLNETSEIHRDSTSNSNDGNVYGNITQDASGKIGGADSFDGYFDEYVYIGDAASLDITDDITVEAWMNVDTDANNVSDGFDIGEANVGEILDEFYYGHGMCYTPETVEVSSNVFATIYRSEDEQLFLTTYRIDDDGIYNATIDMFEVDEYSGYEPDIIHISGNVFLIVYRSLTTQGIMKTVNISGDGTINGIIDAITYDEYAYYPYIVHISGNVYAIQYAGSGSDGYIKTYSIGSDGTLNQTYIDVLEYDTTQGIFNSMVRVGSSDFYGMVREGADGDGWLSTVEIDSSGNIAAAVADSVEYDVADGLDNFLISTDSDSIALAYRTTGNIPWLLTFNISTVDGSILTNVSDSFQFDTYGLTPIIHNISGDYYAITYCGPDSDGWVKTITITDGWDIGSVQDSAEWDLSNGFEPNFYHISGNMYGITYRSDEESFEVAVVEIDTVGEIMEGPADSEYVYSGSCYWPDMINLTGDIYVIAYRGIDGDGYLKTVNMSSSGNVIEVIDTLEFDTVECSYPDLYKFTSDKVAVAYSGYGYDGYIKTYQIYSNGTINQEVISNWEFDTDYGNTPDIFHISGDIYAIAYSGGGYDGFVFTFEMYSNGTIDETKIDFLEYDGSYGLDQSVVKVGSTNIYAIASTGYGSDGWLYTVEILSDGSVGDTVTDSYEFDGSTGLYPNITALSDNYYAIAYTGPENDGWVETVNIASDGTIVGMVEEYEFDGSYGSTPIIQNVNGDTYAIFYRDSGYDGRIITIEITSSNGDIKEVQDNFEFDMYEAYEPSVCLLSDNIFAIAYRTLYYEGKIVTVEIKDNGQVSKSLDFSDYSYEQSLVLVSEANRIYAVAYRGNASGENDGYVKTFQVLDTDGFINKTVIDTLEFETSDCYEPKLFHISGDIYAIVFRGTDNDGYVTTIEIDSSGDIKQVNDTLEFDTVACYRPDMINVSGSIYAITYRDTGSDPHITTVNISDDGQIVDAVVDSQAFDTLGYECKIINISGNVYAIVYRGNDGDGWMKTVNISDDGTINAVAIDSLEFDESYGYYPEVIHVSDETYAIFYAGDGDDGEIVTVNITSAGQISDTVVDRLEKIEGTFIDPEVVSIGNNVFAAVFNGPRSDGYLMTFNISNAGQITNNIIDRNQFQIINCFTPDILYLAGNISVLTYRGVDTGADHGVFSTIHITSEGNSIGDVNFSEILDEFYFERGTCFLPETVEVSSNIFATTYQSEYYKVHLSTYRIDNDGVFNSTIADFVIDDFGGYEPYIINISGDVYAIAYRLRDSDLGILKTVNISSDGTINGVIDSFTFDAAAYYPDIIHISGDVYAIMYGGVGTDGFVRTFHIANDGTINTTMIDELEFDTSYGNYIDAVQVGTSDYYALVYSGDGTDGYLATVEIDSSGNIAAAVADSIEFDEDYCLAPQIVNTSGDSYAFVYRSVSNIGVLKTVNISSVDGSIVVSDSLQFEFEGDFLGSNPRILHVSGVYYAIAYEGPGSDGWLKTVDISSGWDIGSVQDSLEWDLSNGFEPNFYHISGTTYGITYRSNEYHFEVATVDIDINGQVRGDTVDSEYVYNHISYYPDLIHLTGDIYVVAYRGINSDGYMRTIRMTRYGNIIEDIDEFEFDTEYGDYPDLYRLSSDKVAVAYSGYSNDGYIKTYQIYSNGTINSEEISEWEFDTGYGSTPEIFHISGDIYAMAYSGYSNDGFVFTFKMYSNGTINQTKIDYLEYDTAYGLYQSVVRVGSTDFYAIANTGDGSDGWLYTVEIDSSGSIGAAVTSSYEFNPTYALTPNIIALSDNYYAIVYAGPDSDGYLQTVNISSDGTIVGMVEELEFDTVSGYEPILKHISGDIYAIFYSGSGNDGWIKTIEITSSDGDIKEVQDSFEFDRVICRYPSVLQLSEGVYAISYYHTYEEGKIVTLKIKSDGAVSKWLGYSGYAYEQTMVCVSETNGIYAVAYRGNESLEDDGYLKTFQVSSDGFINKTVIDTLEFDTSYCYEPKLFHISGDIYAIVYRGTDNDGYVTTIEIDSSGDIKQVNDTLEFDTDNCYKPDMIHASGSIYAISYQGNGDDPYITTVNISNDGQIVDSVADTRVFDTTGYENKIIHISGNVYAIIYRGPSDDGWMKTVSVYPDGTIKFNAIDSLEFDGSDGYDPEIIHVSNETYAIFYRSTGNDGEIITVTITSAGQISDTVIDRLEGIDGDFREPEVLPISDHIYAVVYRDSSNDGMIQSFEISNSGIIHGNPLEWFEWDINYAYNVKAIYVRNNTYVLTHRGAPTNQYEGVFRTLTIVTNKGVCKDNAYGIDADDSSVFGTINGQSVSISRSSGWNHVVLTYDTDDGQKLYLNGVFRSSRDGIVSIDTNTGNLHVGQYFDGMIDEIRISSGVRNASWIKTSYNTMNNTSTFLSFGSEENNGRIIWSNNGNPDTNSPWSWNFDFPNGSGYYEFSSIGKKSGSPDETSPDNADTICHYQVNTAPTTSPGAPSSSSYTPPPNQNPIANITGSQIGYVNETLIFSAHYSYDPDGRITGYQWDFNKDGIWDTNWLTIPTITHIYTEPGVYTVTVEVKDNRGATDTYNYTVTIRGPSEGMLPPNVTVRNFDLNGTFNTQQPTVTITYGEKVTIVTATLNGIDISDQITTSDFKTFTYTPASDLADGTYTLSITVQDTDGNAWTSTATYYIEVPVTPVPEEFPWLFVIIATIILIIATIILLLKLFISQKYHQKQQIKKQRDKNNDNEQ